MCGIAGCVVAPGERPDREALERMAAALRLRGPDEQGIEVRDNVGLVTARLAIVDPGPAGHQPMADGSGEWLLAFNGEVYNQMELRAELPGRAWRGHSDTETLAEALAEWGEEAIARCNGPLALAALDRRGKRLLLARDRFGKKPLYLARHRGTLWFASEMQALLAAGVPASPRRDVLAHVATRRFVCGHRTPIEEIDRMTPGSLASVDLDTLGVAERSWYRPADAVDPELAEELAAMSRRELSDHLEELLRGSVRRRLMADVPLGTMCSGGVDSSLVTALAHDEHPSIRAFTCAQPDEGRANEARFAERAAREIGVELETVVMTGEDWRRALVAAVRLHEYPLSGAGAVPVTLMAERARSQGIKALLVGEGADELFGGYAFFGRDAIRGVTPLPISLYRAASAILRSGPAGLRPALHRLGLTSLPADIYIDPEPADASWEREAAERAARAYRHHPGVKGAYESDLLTQLTASGFPYLLNRMDKNAMGRSVETRLPFLDPDLAAFALNLPLEARTRPRAKGILRDVARRHLPRRIANRPKQPGLVMDGATRIERVARPAFLADGVLRQALGIARPRWAEIVAARSSDRRTRLWTAEIWARLFLEGRSVETVEGELWR